MDVGAGQISGHVVVLLLCPRESEDEEWITEHLCIDDEKLTGIKILFCVLYKNISGYIFPLQCDYGEFFIF